MSNFERNPMGCNFLGVAFISDDLPKRIHNKVNKKMEELDLLINEMFEKWCDDQGLEQLMGIIVKKGTVR